MIVLRGQESSPPLAAVSQTPGGQLRYGHRECPRRVESMALRTIGVSISRISLPWAIEGPTVVRSFGMPAMDVGLDRADEVFPKPYPRPLCSLYRNLQVQSTGNTQRGEIITNRMRQASDD